MIYNALDNTTHLFDYADAIDLAFKIAEDDEYEWAYTVEIDATTRRAKIAVADEDGTFLGYL